jgi:hypothetical protein
LNVDPNNSTEADVDLMFKYSVKYGSGNYMTSSHMEYNGLHQWMMYFATRGGIEVGTEYTSPTGADAFWSDNYVYAINNAQIIIDKEGDEENLSGKKAAAMIWKCYLMQRLTDLWGDVPYSEAFKGNPELNFTPVYDKQEDVYASMLDELKEAVLVLSKNESFFTEENDLLMFGDKDKWIRFANSLRFKMAIRLSEVDPAYSNQILMELDNEALISSAGEECTFQYNLTHQKPLCEATGTRQNEGVQYINPSKYFVDLLNDLEDPRKKVYLEKTALSDIYPFIAEYRGVPNLLSYNSPEWENYNLDASLGDPLGQYGDVSRVGHYFTDNDRPVQLLSYAEMCFLQAEAALNGNWDGDALEYFKDGIRANMEYINEWADESDKISEFEIVAYINQFDQVDIETIITQKYLLFTFENVIEAFTEYRRTGFPILVDYSGEKINEDDFPNRLRYPFSEYTYNNENYLNAVADQGPDDLSTKVYWDVE